MAIEMDWRNVKDRSALIAKETDELVELSGLGQVLMIYLGLSMGVYEVSPKTIDELMLRVRMWESAVGPGLVTGPLTRADVEKAMGLKTNGASFSRAEFRKRLAKTVEEKAQRSLKREAEAAKTVADEAARAGASP